MSNNETTTTEVAVTPSAAVSTPAASTDWVGIASTAVVTAAAATYLWNNFAPLFSGSDSSE